MRISLGCVYARQWDSQSHDTPSMSSVCVCVYVRASMFLSLSGKFTDALFLVGLVFDQNGHNADNPQRCSVDVTQCKWSAIVLRGRNFRFAEQK